MKIFKNIVFMFSIVVLTASPLLHAQKQNARVQTAAVQKKIDSKIKVQSQHLTHQMFTILRDRRKSEKIKYQEINELFPSTWELVKAWFTRTTLQAQQEQYYRRAFRIRLLIWLAE